MQAEPWSWASDYHLTQKKTSRNVNGSDLWEKSRFKKHSENKVFVFNIMHGFD